jgi:hypothetical protein
MTGRRSIRTAKVERITAAGLPLYQCSQCGRQFCTEEARKNHIQAKHLNGVAVQSSKRTHQPYTRPPATTPAVVPLIKAIPIILEVDFVTASDSLSCKWCGQDGAMPLTGMCFECDPIRLLEAEEALLKATKKQAEAAKPEPPPHSNVLMLPRPGMGAPTPPAALIPSEHPAFTGPGNNGQIPDFLRRPAQGSFPLAPTIN